MSFIVKWPTLLYGERMTVFTRSISGTFSPALFQEESERGCRKESCDRILMTSHPSELASVSVFAFLAIELLLRQQLIY